MQCQGVLVEKQSMLLALLYKRIWHDFHNQFYKISSCSYPLFSFAVVIVKCSMVFTSKSPVLWKIRKFWNWKLITSWVIPTIISMAHACNHWVLISALQLGALLSLSVSCGRSHLQTRRSSSLRMFILSVFSSRVIFILVCCFAIIIFVNMALLDDLQVEKLAYICYWIFRPWLSMWCISLNLLFLQNSVFCL
jgi:hypothetical protein